MCLDCFDQGCPPDIKDMGQNSGQWRGGLISMSRCDDCPCPHCSHSTLSSWAHLVMTDSRGRVLLASKLVNVSNLNISEACLVSGAHLFEVMCFLGVSPLWRFIGVAWPWKVPRNGPGAPKVAESGARLSNLGAFVFCGVAPPIAQKIAPLLTVQQCDDARTDKLYICPPLIWNDRKEGLVNWGVFHLMFEKELSEDSTTLL